MKQILFFITFSMIGLTSIAQVKQGSIIFEKKINMYRKITDEQMRSYVSEFRTSKHVLTFSDSVSNYKPLVELESNEGGDGGNRMMGFSGESSETYKNYSNLKMIVLSDVANTSYNITDTVKLFPWVKTDETKVILGYTCHKATLKQKLPARRNMFTAFSNNSQAKSDSTKLSKKVEEKEIEIVAWYAKDLVSPAGPDQFGGLPGVILQIDSDNEETVYTALEFDKKVGKKDLNEPNKGKKVTRGEMRDIQKKYKGVNEGEKRHSDYGKELQEQKDLRNLRNNYLHWSADKAGIGMEPTSDRKRLNY